MSPIHRSRELGARSLSDSLIGCLVGTAVGDSVGLPAEGLSRRRVARRFPGPWRHRLLLGRGLLSDDTEQSLLVAQSLLAAGGDVARFRRTLAYRLRWWLLALPAGVGLATLRAILRLWLGWPPARSGVRSAGNGAAMRVGLLGVHFAAEPEQRESFVVAATALTHSDPRALVAARAVAETAAWCSRQGRGEPAGTELLTMLRTLPQGPDREWAAALDRVALALDRGETVDDLARDLGLECGITGYAYHTVPMVVFALLRHWGDARATLEALWRCGGDTDTTGAVAGALVGATWGESVFPDEWIDGIVDWPRSLAVLRRAGELLAGPEDQRRPVRYPAWTVPLRNLVFLKVVLVHGVRRLFP